MGKHGELGVGQPTKLKKQGKNKKSCKKNQGRFELTPSEEHSEFGPSLYQLSHRDNMKLFSQICNQVDLVLYQIY